MCDALPRELRDMVYDQMYQSHKLDCGNTYANDCSPDASEPGGVKIKASIENDFRHLGDQSKVEPVFAEEFAEAWYREISFCPFSFRVLDISDYLVRSRWGFGIVPTNILQNVTIGVLEAALRFSKTHPQMEGLRAMTGLRPGTHVYYEISTLDNYNFNHCVSCNQSKSICDLFENFLSI